MRKIKKILFIVIFVLIIFNTSCQKENHITSNVYHFSIDDVKKENVLSSIDQTKQNEVITYKDNNEMYLLINVFYFTEGYATTKVIYRFYNNIDDFRRAILNHNDNLDGSLIEVSESILLIKTQYSKIDKVSYNQLYSQIKDKYTII